MECSQTNYGEEVKEWQSVNMKGKPEPFSVRVVSYLESENVNK